MDKNLQKQLNDYKKKHYLNSLIKGSLFLLTYMFGLYYGFALLEYYAHMPTQVRAVCFYGYIFSASLLLLHWVGRPILQWIGLAPGLTDEEAAQQIGQKMPEVADRLLNTLQLSRSNQGGHNTLLAASLQQRVFTLSAFRFTLAINLRTNLRYLRWAVPPILATLLTLLVVPGMLQQSTHRLVKYKQAFEPTAPFSFALKTHNLKAFYNEDFTIKLALEGNALPTQVQMITGTRTYGMQQNKAGLFTTTLKNLRKPQKFYFEAAGFSSAIYQIEMIHRPALNGSEIKLEYPAYLNKKNQTIENMGNLTVPEGTQLTFIFKTNHTDSLYLTQPQQSNPQQAVRQDQSTFVFKEKMLKPKAYNLNLTNQHSHNTDKLSFAVDVIADQRPQITLNKMADTVLYQFLYLGGSITDDYGITNLQLHYRKVGNQTNNSPFKTKKLYFNPTQTTQQYMHQWPLDSLKLQTGQRIEYYVAVWDNDGVNGPKMARTTMQTYKIPDAETLQKELEKERAQTRNQLDKAEQMSRELQKKLENTRKDLKSKKHMDWQQKKNVREMMKQVEQMQKTVEELKKQQQTNQQRNQKFNNNNPEIKQKMESLQKLMDKLLDDETKELYDKLMKMLEKNVQPEQMDKMLQQMEKKQKNMMNELDRALEMYKQLEMEMQLDKVINKLEQTAQKQEKLAKETNPDLDQKPENNKTEQKKPSDKPTEDQKNNPKKDNQPQPDKNQPKTDNQQEAEKQKQLNEEFKQVKEDLKKLDELNKNLENERKLPQNQDKQQSIEQNQKQSLEQLQQNNQNKAGQNQQKAADQMSEMANQMKSAKMKQQEQQHMEDMKALRQLLENLLYLSFEQEELMEAFKQVNRRDPRFVELGQEQLKLRNDAQMIEDSLMALAKRVVQIESFVTREVTDMRDFMEQSIDAIKERNPRLAAGKQQFTMTSVNNLSLMLSEVLDQMQQQMAMKMKGNQNCQNPKPNSSQPMPSLGQMQKELNQQIDQLKKSGKTGKPLSEELAKMAAEQEAIRRRMQEMQEKLEQGGNKAGDQLSDLIKKMEKTEEDLVYKRLTKQLVERQQQILTRLLKAENAMRERELDQERKAQTANKKYTPTPPDFEKYLQEKEKQTELLKTKPPALTPFYKKEVERYFKQLNTGQ